MKKRKVSLSLIAIAGCLVFASTSTIMTSCSGNSTSQVTKYTVTPPATNADYTITGLASEYAKGDTVSFTVTVNNTAKKIKSVTANGSTVNGTDGKYSFQMPEANVTLAVTLEDKDSSSGDTPTTNKLVATYSGTAQVGNTLTVTATYDGDPCTSFTLTDKSDTAGMISITGTTISCLKEGKAKVEVSYSDAKTTLEIDIAKDACQSLKDIYKEVGAELTTSSTKAFTSKSYTTRAVIVAIGDTSSSYVDVIFYDGETYGTLSIGNSYLKDTSSTAIAIGTTYRISGKMCNYWGVFEFKNDTTTTDKVYISFEKESNSSNFVTAPTTPTAWTGTEFDNFKNLQAANNTTLTDAQKETGVPLSYVSITGTYGNETSGSNTYSYLYVDGDTNRKVSLSKTSAAALGTLTEGTSYDVSMYLLGYNTSYGYLNVIVDHIEVKKIDATSITIDTPADDSIDINESLNLTVTTDPANANGAITWNSSDTAIATVNAGKVTGVAAGKASITATITNSDGSIKTSNAIEITVNEHVAKCTVLTKTTTNGTIALKDSDGNDITTGTEVKPGEITIVATPDAGYEVTRIYYVTRNNEGGSTTTDIEATDGVYKFTTVDGGNYTFGAEFSEIAVTSIADAKNLKNGEYVKVVGKVIASEGTSAYINDGTSGIYIYNWNYDSTLDSGLTDKGKFTLGDTVEIYGVVGTNAGAKQLLNYANKARYADSYVKTSNKAVTTSTVTELSSADDFKGLTAADTGKKYKFKARFSKTDGTPSSSFAVNVTFIQDNTSITLRTSKYDANVTAVSTLISSLNEGDYVEVESVLSWYNGFQFAFLGDGSTTITKATEETATSITISSENDKVGVGQTTKLSSEVKPWNASSDGVTYEFATETSCATISGDTLTGVSAGTVSVVAKLGSLTSDPISIEITTEAQTEVIHSVTFNKTNNPESTNQYDTSFENTSEDITYVVNCMSTNSNNWEYVACGRKNNPSTASIVTKSPFANPIKKSTITFGSKATTTNLTSAYLYVSTKSDFSGEDVQKFDIKDKIAVNETVTTKITTPTANAYYKYEFVTTSASANGFIIITGLTFVE